MANSVPAITSKTPLKCTIVSASMPESVVAQSGTSPVQDAPFVICDTPNQTYTADMAKRKTIGA
jgi:hypothetical protein